MKYLILLLLVLTPITAESATVTLSVTVAEPQAVPVLIEDVPMMLIDSEAEALKKALTTSQ